MECSILDTQTLSSELQICSQLEEQVLYQIATGSMENKSSCKYAPRSIRLVMQGSSGFTSKRVTNQRKVTDSLEVKVEFQKV